jgi:hypothetical protein
MQNECDLTILMPCLNEAETLAGCIEKAQAGLERVGLRGEVLVADNGSSDESAAIARKAGARVITVRERGYGSALRAGIGAARGKWVIMGDADGSYDFSRIEGFVEKLRGGFDLVPWKNRWVGNPALSFIGRLLFKCPARDFHCGLRGFAKDACRELELKTTGMEFASEMLIKATLKSLRIAEVPITLHPDGRSRAPHLRPWRDGWRHLRFMLIYSPRWLFLVPGLLLSVLGAVAGAVLAFGTIHLGNVHFSTGTLAVACMSVIIGTQLVAFAFFTKVFAVGEGLLPQDPKFSKVFHTFTLEKGICFGLAILGLGLGLLLHSLWLWKRAGYGLLPYADNMRRLLPAVTLIILSIQIVFSSFFMSVLGLKTDSRRPPNT